MTFIYIYGHIYICIYIYRIIEDGFIIGVLGLQHELHLVGVELAHAALAFQKKDLPQPKWRYTRDQSRLSWTKDVMKNGIQVISSDIKWST